MSQTTTPVLTAVTAPVPDSRRSGVPTHLSRVGLTPTGPSAHPTDSCPGCVALGRTSSVGDYSSHSDFEVTLSICLPGPHDRLRSEPLLMWSGASGERGVLPLAHHTGYHPYFTEVLERFEALPTPPAPAEQRCYLEMAA